MADDFYCDEVLSGRTPVVIVAETPRVLAFEHTRAHWPIHVVVIPKPHVTSLTTIDSSGEDLLLELLRVVREVAAKLEAEHGGAHIVANLGVYQESQHLHWHVSFGEPPRQCLSNLAPTFGLRNSSAARPA